MAKDAFYFSHDSNARNDPKMIKARRIGGMEIIGMYWCVIEMLRESESYELSIDSIEDICFDLRFDVSKFEILFISKLLIQKDSIFYSSSLKNRMLKRDKVIQKRREAGTKGGKSKANAKQMPDNSPPNKGKERKGKYIKEKEINKEIPSFDEFKKYALDNKPRVDLTQLELKYKAWVANGWKDGNDKQIKNWKSKLLNTLIHISESGKDGIEYKKL